MSRKRNITQSNPNTGASPAQQTADNFASNQDQTGNTLGMMENDKLIYELVQKNVEFAGSQFSDNLWFNTIVLTDVLYENLYKLLNGKFEESDFVDWVAQELLNRGCVFKGSSENNDNEVQEKPQEPEVVVELDSSSYDDLIQRVYQAIELIKANRITIFKLFSDVDNQIKEIGDASGSQIQVSRELLAQRDEKLKEWIDKLQENQLTIDNYLEQHAQGKKDIENSIKQLQESFDSVVQPHTTSLTIKKNNSGTQILKEKISEAFKSAFDKIAKSLKQPIGIENKETEITEPEQKEEVSQENKLQETTKEKGETQTTVHLVPQPKDDEKQTKPTSIVARTESRDEKQTSVISEKTFPEDKGTKIVNKSSSLVTSISPKKSDNGQTIFGQRSKTFPNLEKRLGRNDSSSKANGKRLIGRKKLGYGAKRPGFISSKLHKLNKRISNSPIGKVLGGIKKVGAIAVGAVVGTAMLGVKAVNGFAKASKFVGGILRKGVERTASKVKSYIDDVKKANESGSKDAKTDIALKPIKAITLFNPAAFIAKITIKLGWNLLKFVGKKLWSGIKKVSLGLVGIFGGLLRVGKKFINKDGYYVGRIGGWIRDKAYRFLVKPLSSILVTVFGFTMAVVKSPVNFMKWLIPTVFNRIHDCMSAIGQATKRVLNATKSIFKRILFHPLTIALVIGGLFFIIWKFFGNKLTSGFTSLKDGILGTVKNIASKVWNFVKTVASVLWTVGIFLFTTIEKITSPDGWLAKAIVKGVKIFLAIKKGITELMKASGTSTIDAFCEFLAGDTIGIAIRMVGGLVVKAWKYISRVGIFRTLINLVKAVVGWSIMWGKLLFNCVTALPRLVWAAMKGKLGSCLNDLFVKPITDWWDMVTGVFKGSDAKVINVKENPIELNEDTATNAKTAIRGLKKVGMNGNNVAKEMDRLQSTMNVKGTKGVIERLESMDQLYQTNSKQVAEYNTFIEQAWEMGKGNSEVSKKSLRTMVESPELSQRLMSAFFYYDPQNGKVMTTRPQSYMNKFLNQIRDMVLDEDMDEEEKFKTFIEAFDQLNKERSVIVNKQGDTIIQFTEQMSNLDMKSENATQQMTDMVKSLNNGTFFKNIDVKQSFNQIKKGDAITKDIDSVTGSKLGTNKLLEKASVSINPEKEEPVKDDQFVVKVPKKDRNEVVPNIVIPPGMNPTPPPEKFDEQDGKSMRDKWLEHQRKRREVGRSGVSDSQLDKMGLKNYTYDEFIKAYKKKNPPTDKEIKEKQEYQKKRLEGLRLAKDIQAYNNQGKVANVSGFDMPRKPSILSIETDMLNQTMLLFSPEWQKVQGAARISDAELLMEIGIQDDKEREKVRAKIRAQKEAERKKKEEEEKERKREQEILDYSAKVSGGVIEVKIGEDETAMREAWILHQRKRRETGRSGVSDSQLDKMGLKNYTWEEWKTYYRKMHGLPEDGIKRIPFEGKKKERKIDWEPRKALSTEELSKYGIKVSEDGPVMIPLKQAMDVSNALLSGAKTIYSVRDGLELMKQGLDSETQRLKKEREGGLPFAAISTSSGDDGGQVAPIEPPSPSPQQQFENRF